MSQMGNLCLPVSGSCHFAEGQSQSHQALEIPTWTEGLISMGPRRGKSKSRGGPEWGNGAP